MDTNKPIVTIIFPDKLGGVYIVMNNLKKYIPDNFSFFTVSTNLTEDNYPTTENTIREASQLKFNFSKYENRYSVYKRLLKNIPQDTKIIIANDYLELEAIAGMKLKTKLIFILHGDYDYYYDLAIKYSGMIDKFIGVSNFIKEKLTKQLPERKDDILYLKNIIANPTKRKTDYSKIDKKIIFVGRLKEDKGYFDLEKIDNELKKQNIVIKWTIIGEKFSQIDYSWLENENVIWLGAMPNEDVLNEYYKHDLFILPSRAEGLGMVIIEAMKSGCVPIVSKLDAGIPEFIIQGNTGYMIDIGDIKIYVSTIINLFNSPEKLEELSKNAKNKAYELFDPKRDAMEYGKLFSQIIDNKNNNYQFPKLNLSRLDKKIIPNFLVKAIRSIIKHPKI